MDATTMTSTAATKICKKTWTPEEDAKMLALIAEHGTTGKWTLICSIMGDRSSKQCRERYANHLHPDIRKGGWTKEEDDLIDELQRQMGMQWAKICKFLKGRSDNAVKNRWYIHNRPKFIEDESAAPAAAAKATTTPVKAATEKKARPVVPTLNLDACKPRAAPAAAVPAVPVNVDLLDMYHNHHDCCHEVSLSSRSEGYEYAGESSSARLSCVSARLLLCSARFSDLDETDSWMEELLYSDESSDDDEEMHQLMLKTSISDAKLNASANVNANASAVPLLNLGNLSQGDADEAEGCGALLSGVDFDCDLFDFDLLENSSPNLQPGSACGNGGAAAASTLKRVLKFTPRTTPRSPMPFLVKRQRGSLSARLLSTTPRS